MADLIDREFIKGLGGECIARRDRETGELIAITGIDLLPSAQPEQLGTDLAEVGTDCISRQAAIDYCYQLINVEHQQGSDETSYGRERVNQTEAIMHHLEVMSSAQPMRKKGEWIDRSVFDEPQGKRIEQWQSAKCSVCGKYHTTPYLYYFDWYDWCPNCGADMRPKRGVEG